MTNDDLLLLRRKAMVGFLAAAAWTIALLDGQQLGSIGAISAVAGWLLTAYYVKLDATYRGDRVTLFTMLAFFTGPVGLAVYLLSRSPSPQICMQCGDDLTGRNEVCSSCGYQSMMGRATCIYVKLMDSLTRAPVEQARNTVRYMAIALGAVVLFGITIRGLPGIWVLAFPVYWIAVAWWVYLDATWRKMDAVPWGVLTLLINVFGLVTYLVVRHPDPRSCPQCGAHLATGLKRCPYCGAEAEPTCPRCQSPVRADWVYCPACAAQLPTLRVSPPDLDQPSQQGPVQLAIMGNVMDARGSAVPGAEVKIDSKTIVRATTTDELGKFVLEGLEPRPYVLIASADGYAPDAKGYTPSSHGPVNFTLHPVAEPATPEAEMVNG